MVLEFLREQGGKKERRRKMEKEGGRKEREGQGLVRGDTNRREGQERKAGLGKFL